MEKTTNNTSNKELMESALKHYDEVSSKAHCWLNSIPKAIKHYFSTKTRDEIIDCREQRDMVLELEQMIIAADEFGNDHNDRKEMRVLFSKIKNNLLHR